MPDRSFAATNSPSSPTPTPQVSMFQGKTFVMQTTPKEAASIADKQKISNEYSNVLHGSESLSTYEAHYKAFMTKWNLGDSSKLHAILTGSNKHNKLTVISANLQNNIVSDIATGWDVPIGLYLHPYRNTLQGYPIFTQEVDHWIAAIYDTNSTVYYADPTYNSPDFTPPTWTTPGPYASTDIGTLSQFVPFYLW